MKIKKGDKIYPFITGDDVVITKGLNHSGKTVDETIEEVDNTLDEHKREIDKLKSNLKYVYSYGGVGGRGTGGSGGGDISVSATPYVSLNKRQLKGDGSIIILNGPGSYTVEMSISNSQGRTFYVEVYYANRTRPDNFTLSTEKNKCKESYNITLNTNGEIIVRFFDDDGNPIAEFSQYYIVNPHTFNTKFMYEFDNGVTVSDIEFIPYEYFVGNTTQKNPFFFASYKIDVQNVSNVSLTCEIGNTVVGVINLGSKTQDTVKIYLNDIEINGNELTNESNTGTYTVSITLRYTSNATENASETKSFDITIIPNYLYINVRNSQNLIYDTLDDIRNAINSCENGIPQRSLSVGTYTSFYCKVFEGSMITAPERYSLRVNAYSVTMGDNPGDEIIGDISLIGTIERTLTEQQENTEPISMVFSTPGVKMIVFSTNGKKDDIPDGEPTRKYIYIKEKESNIKWYPENGLSQNVFYFRANQGDNTYSINFPQLSSGIEPLEIRESGDSIILTNSFWANPSTGNETTILSLGIQYSSANKDNSIILRTYTTETQNEPDVTLYSDTFYSKNICIPKENSFDKIIASNYHLVQIVRHKIGYINTTPQWATYLYIDGKLESNNPEPDGYRWVIRKIILNNVNVIYNLISIQYVNLVTPDAIKVDRFGEDKHKKHTIDGLIYQYYLAYKEIMDAGDVTFEEKELFDKLSDIKFDGENVIVNYDFVNTISPSMPIPTLMMEYNNNDDEELNKFKENLFKGYRDNDTLLFGTQYLTNLYWCNGTNVNNSSLVKVVVPEVTDPVNNETYTGVWQVELQGTSTMKNKIKNFSLILETKDESTHTKKLLMSPNYKDDDSSTFLPERVWTLKADIADSAHANNTSIGKFVNRVCTKFSKDLQLDTSVSSYVKNTLEGFPVLMYFKIGEDVYYLGVYNFNMGRGSHYNLGYIKNNDMVSMKNNIQTSTDINLPFCYSIGSDNIIDTLAIGEVQDNFPEFDYHQYDHSVLFNDNDGDVNDGRSTMFGKNSKITGKLASAKTTLENFVKSVSKAGAYCFANIGKKAKSSKDDSSYNCVKRYELEMNQETGKYIECVPDIHHQFRYNGNVKEWFEVSDTFDNIKDNINNLLQCISDKDSEGVSQSDYHYLDFKSASEYYTVCIAFALVDSILKNQNIKSWNGQKCYVAFYDMDCAFGEDNAGRESITYLAATDYWYSESKDGYLEPVNVKFDYWDSTIGSGFDYPSSYLFAIAKYAQAILGNMDRYPQQFWAELRQKNTVPGTAMGQLQSADYFIDNYFSSGIGEIPAYMASLNYQVKYLYKGEYFDAENEVREKFLANEGAFNGSRIEKVREWLNKRFHFLDVMFNIQAIDYPIGNGVYKLPKASLELLSNLSNDVIILSDAFTINNESNVWIDSNSVPVKIKAPKNTPFIANRGKENYVYILNAETGEDNEIRVNTTRTLSSRFLGSTEFTNVSIIDPFLNTSNQISSNNLEEVIYGGMEIPQTIVEYTINSTSIKNIKFNIPTFKGTLTISKDGLYGQALQTLNISESGLTGTWDNLSSLKSLNISSVNNPQGNIVVSNCPLVGDGYSIISGLTENKPTTLNSLSLLGVSGNFTINNTGIEKIDISIKDGNSSSFSINGDYKLRELKLTGFESVVIKNCPLLDTLVINEGEVNKCKRIIIEIPDYQKLDGTKPEGIKKFRDTSNGVFDFTQYNLLEEFGLSGCKNVEVIKLPNKKVSITSLRDNINLEFVDTFGENSVLEITKDSTFFNCPRYAMRQSWGATSEDNGKNINTLTSSTYTGDMLKYTKMCVGNTCKSLAHTFDKLDSSILSNYKNVAYVNKWGQSVKNQEITMSDVCWFINNVVGGENIDGSYIDETGIIHSTSSTIKPFGEDMQSNIQSLSGCFYEQGGIVCNKGDVVDLPNLSGYTSLNDISIMYYGTGVKIMTEGLLSLPDICNNPQNPMRLNWSEFIGHGSLDITKGAFRHISYRIEDLSNMQLSVYDPEDTSVLVNTDDSANDDVKYLDIIDVLCPQYNGNDEIIPFNKLKSFSSFSINSEQWVDYRKLFVACPEVRNIINFLNNDLRKSEISGLLKPCKKLERVTNSFNHTGAMGELGYAIDLYEFFNWEDSSSYAIQELFSSDTNQAIGFSIKKLISKNNFIKILNKLHNFTNITKLTNIFSYCTIEDYDGTAIKLVGDMDNVRNINSLFYNCTTDNDVPLNIGRSFFEHLKNVSSMANTFYGVRFAHMPTYDFFCKRKIVYEPVRVKVGGNIVGGATLKTYGYTNTITNMYNCFGDAKFVNCKSWFDISDGNNEELKPENDVVEYGGNNYQTYYKSEGGIDVEYSVSKQYAYTDTLNNFTNYVNQVRCTKVGSGDFVINNHNLANDLRIFGNDNNVYPYTSNEFNIYPTYCCLPPDMFYCCNYNCDLTNVFANTNIIGVIPQHLLEKCYNGKFNDMFKNVNILPNLIYHYNKKTANTSGYLNLIRNIEVDNTTITTKENPDDIITYTLSSGESTVLFRNADGELRRRRPIENDEYSKSQFTYIPQGYTSNSNLQEAFTFRYNIPENVDLVSTKLEMEYGINWPVGNYPDSTYSPEINPEMWPYYTQYFFMVDESVDWNKIYNMNNPFITTGKDVNFEYNDQMRVYENRPFSSHTNDYRYTWYSGDGYVSKDIWDANTNGVFNVFLNLCGRRDRRTGKITDSGCMISKSMSNNPKLDMFISDSLVTFLNGRVFDDSTDAGRFTILNGSTIIQYTNGFGRNIKLPYIMTVSGYGGSGSQKVLLSYGKETSKFYKYMFNTIDRYKNIYEIPDGIISNDEKYIVQ